MVVNDDNLNGSTEPVEPAPPAAPAEAPERGGQAVTEAPGAAEPSTAAEAGQAVSGGTGDQSGILSLSRALDVADAGADGLAVSPSMLPPDAPVAPNSEECADRADTPEMTDGGDRAEEARDTEEPREAGRPAPAPLNALDALGVLGPERVNVNLLPRRAEGGDDPMAPMADEAAPDPAVQFQTIFRQAVLDEVREHAESQDQVEVCGVLVGSVYESATGAFCYVEGCIRGSYATGGSAQVTFTAETWQHIDREMEEKFPGRKIVGWYHTHPGFGIFLSEMDLFIQRHFFNAPWQTALVYDPRSKERGLFGWDGTEIVRQTFVLDNEIGPAVTEAAGPNLSPKPHGLEDDPAGGATGSALELTARIKVLEQRQRYMLVGMAALMLIAFVWPLVVLVVNQPEGSGTLPGAGGPPPVNPSPAVDHPGSTVTQGVDSASAGLP